MSKEFLETRTVLKLFAPLRDDVLITGNVIEQEGDDLVDSGKTKYYLNFVQTVKGIGPSVPEGINIGDEVMIDQSFLNNDQLVQKAYVVLNDDVNNQMFVLPSRYIMGVVKSEQVENEKLNTKIDDNE